MRNVLRPIMILHIFVVLVSAQEKTSGLLERSEIEEKYKWNTSDIYENDQAWEKDYQWLEKQISRYDEYKDKLGASARQLSECLKFDEQIKRKLGYVSLYAKLHKDIDMRNEEYKKRRARYQSLASRVEAASAFISPAIIQMSEKQVQDFIKQVPQLKIYQHYFKTLADRKAHTLTKEKEDLLAKAAKLVDNPYGVFGSLVYAEIPFPVIKNDKNEDVQLNRSISWRARSSSDRDYRKRGYQEYYKSLAEYKGTLSKNLNSLIDGKIFTADARNYENTLEASLARYNIPVEVYHNLIKSVKSNLQPFHRWMKMKTDMLKLDTLHIYDTRVSMFSETPKEYSWEEARDLTFVSLNKLGEDYLKPIRDAYDNRWIDAYPSPGKETGGYSSGCAGPHPYVKMNWGGKLFDFYTLVHELGHYVHSTKLMKAQPFIYQDYPPMLGEVASTTAENISQFYLIKSAESKDDKLYQIEKYLDNVILMICNSAMMAEFELSLYQKVENGGSLSADELSEMYRILLQEYYGPDVTIDQIDTFGWLEWPHYYLDYYLYSYAASFAASIQIASNIVEEGKPAVSKFINFLEAGTSDYPVEVLKKAGVDLTKPEPYEAAAIKMNELMDELEKLSGK